jgi:hypothetical protein
MNPEPSALARLVIAYHEMFGSHAPESVLRRADPGDLAAMLEASLATGVPIAEAELGYASPVEFNPRGCVLRSDNPDRATPKKGPDGEWLQ